MKKAECPKCRGGQKLTIIDNKTAYCEKCGRRWEKDFESLEQEMKRYASEIKNIPLTSEPEWRLGLWEHARKNGVRQLGTDIATLFVQLLFSRYQEEGRDYWIDFRYYRETNGSEESEVQDRFYKLEDIKHSINEIVKPNQDGWDIYLGINPRPPSKKKKKRDIRDVVAIWVDIDAKNFLGGKSEALQRIENFLLDPTIIVDSGHGYHLYWVLEEPVINGSAEELLQIEQIMAGLIVALGADRAVKDISHVMRLPGTRNLKNPHHPKKCEIIQINPKKVYSPGNFEDFQARDYKPVSIEPTKELLDFGKKTLSISNETQELAEKDVDESLEVRLEIKRMICTGDLPKDGDKTRSGRDMRIIVALIEAEYTFETLRNIFTNALLGCSDRILEKGEPALSYDIQKALKFVAKRKKQITLGEADIREIKRRGKKTGFVMRDISNHILLKLLDPDEGRGKGYKNDARKSYYYFDNPSKILLEVDRRPENAREFYCFLKGQFGLIDPELREVCGTLMASIWERGEPIEPHILSYYDPDTRILYVSNHDNQIFKLDGSKIQIVDNGTDGVIFEFNPSYIPPKVDLNSRPKSEYFKGGFDWQKFKEKSLLNRHVIELSNFATEETHNLTAEDQQYLLSIYIYSLFFEEIIQDKPIICFKGVKASGKSFISELIGKILFGSKFYTRHIPDNLDNLRTTLINTRYLVFDNVDSHVPGAVLNDLCSTATGAQISARKKYSDHVLTSATPHVFLVITSREPKFKRDDFVDRLLIFNTKKIKAAKGRAHLFNTLLAHRGDLWGEMLTNLNAIVALLKQRADWNPAGIFRMADWELFGKKIHSEKSMTHFVGLLEKMNKEKSKFGLEDDPLYILLVYIVIEKDRPIDGDSASDLYEKLETTATDLHMNDFKRRYKSPMSVAKRLSNIQEELEDEFDISIHVGRSKQKVYHISKKTKGE